MALARSALGRVAFCAAMAYALEARAQAQLGHAVKAQKISETAGGFSGDLDEMDQFGRSIVSLGDLDSDGVTDVLVGAHTDDDGGLNKGAVYVLFLHPNGFVKGYQKISDVEGNFSGNLSYGDQFGRAATNLGDLDGDGVVDVAVSANYDDDGGTNKGAVYILFLNVDGTVKASQKISSLQGGLPVELSIHDEFGRSLTSLGDMDGDGVGDLLVGTPEDDEGGTNTGALHVLFLNADGTVKNYRRISKFVDNLAIKPGDWFGFCSTNLGDFDGDGVVDVAVGAVLDDDGGTNQGSVWILFLNADGSVKEAHEIDELEGGLTGPLDDIDHFGTSVANIGDLDGDGVTDIAVGAVKDDDGGIPGNPDADVGAVYVLLLSADATVKACIKIGDVSGNLPYSLDQYDWFGSAVSAYGGAPGDSLFNMVIGCRNDDDAGGNHGAIYMVQLNDGTAPVSDFVASRTLGVAPMTVEFTDTSSGEITGWIWNLGEGPQTTLQSPVKTYEAPGLYDVQLTTRGPKGTDVELRSAMIRVVNGPLAFFEAAPRSGPCPLNVVFTDSSQGVVTAWSWDFGDGTGSTEASPTHVYAECGTYTVALTVTSPSGSYTLTEADYVMVAFDPPSGEFAGLPTSGHAPLDVQFSDATTGPVTSWYWDFGDGTSATEQAPLHRYENPGTYSVFLTAGGPGGSDTESKADYVFVDIGAPVADFDATPTQGPKPLSVAFDDLTTGEVSAWLWDFGDGQTSSEENPLHVYLEPGLYGVTLTATGPGGSDVLARSGLITVESAPPGPAFSATPTKGSAPLSVQFTDLSTLNAREWIWDFGDGTNSILQHPTHAYDTPGRYSVSLTVLAPSGAESLVQPDLIVVSPPPTRADFSVDPSSGAVPLTVAFTDLSSSNVTSWSWDFGDGTSSIEQSPAHFYGLTGAFTVVLQVTSPTGTDTVTRVGLVSVQTPPPDAAFSATPTGGVAPLAVQFSDQSTGVITAWAWDFGDGASSRDSSPLHDFPIPGAYPVSLTVTGPGGTSTFGLVDPISVLEPAPVAAFTADPVLGDAPLGVQFTDASPGTVTAWAWDFGDGSTSGSASPAHVYTTPGTYAVTLSVSGPGGGDSVTHADLVTVRNPPPVASFTSSATTGFVPMLVQFTNTSGGTVTSWAWDFGDGGTSSDLGPAHVYTTPGTYTVTLTASGPAGVDVLAMADLITVADPTPLAGFVEDVSSGFAPLRVQFTDASSGAITSWFWDFGDGGSSTDLSPAYVYGTPGTFSVTLSLAGPSGSDAITKSDLVTVLEPPPVADFSVDPGAGFAPLAVQFTDVSTGAIASWAWDFGDGSASAEATPLHLYATPGVYSVTLAVTSPGGVDALTRAEAIVVDDPALVPDFLVDVASGLAPLPVQFTDASTGAITSWAWDFGDGLNSTESSPAHVYAAAGRYSVTLSVTGPDGSEAITKSELVTVTEPPPVADFTLDSGEGFAPLPVQFMDASRGAVTSWAWDFGDGGTSTEVNPLHTYSTPGVYSVTLMVTNSGGVDALTRSDRIVADDPVLAPSFSVDVASGVAPLSVKFTDTSSGRITAWAWDFGDGLSSVETDPSHVYAEPGAYSVTLTITGPGGSEQVLWADMVKVTEQPTIADFSVDPSKGFAPLSVQFSDDSLGRITSWLWDFGDGGTSSLASQPYLYGRPGVYDVSLTVTGPGGTDTLTKSGFVVVEDPAPLADFTADRTSGIMPLAVKFADASSGLISAWAWDFGDGGSSMEASPSYVYATPGTYSVILTVTGPEGAQALTKTDFIRVEELFPVADFTLAPPRGFAPLAVQFTEAATGQITSWLWDFGDGGTSTEESPSHAYATPGLYSVTLTATGPPGSDSATKADLVSVDDPTPVADFGFDTVLGLAPLTVQFSDASAGQLTSWSWDFGDGETSTETSPSHVYANAGTYAVALIVTGPSGSDSLTRADLIVVNEPPPTADFTVQLDRGPLPARARFTDLSAGAISSWAWDFGDGATSDEANPIHHYTAVGNYTVSLAVSSPGGTDQVIKTDVVVVRKPPPVAKIGLLPGNGFGPLRVAFVDLTTGDVTAVSWDFGDGQGSNQPSPVHEYSEAGSYAVTLTASGPGGVSRDTQRIQVSEVPAFADGSFEWQVDGLPPQWPWTVFNGDSVRVRSTPGGDHPFPTRGAQWCDIAADEAAEGIAPSNPGGPGTGATGGSGIAQDFRFPSQAPHLFFKAAFLYGGPRESASQGEFMSVDLTDGATTWNLFYADGLSDFPLVSEAHGLAMTAAQKVHVDLRDLFPGANEGTLLSLRVGVAGMGNAVAPSHGYVDDFRLAGAASATFRNGHDINPAIYSASPAILGGAWTLDIDATNYPEAHTVLVAGGDLADPGTPRFGGEALIGGTTLFSLRFASSGGAQRFVIPIPDSLALLGRSIPTQAILLGNGFLLTNAYDLVLGY